ncbi:MAG TPA: DEAD/DEAH box helicase [Candidatus Deferrimicrobium sp.]|nr:DEAD/DEAH box helicase [Candidatus Deferrimicrobium sp.]
MTTSFEQLGLMDSLLLALKQEGILEPTEIQQKAIPLALENRDVLGQSETGSGKTLAYLLPIIQKVDPSKREVQAMVLTPTHELAIQVLRQIESLTQNSKAAVSATAIIGNVNITRQIEKLKEKPHILVGSSGRILELIQKKKINMQTIKTIVLDEADRLLDDNNVVTVKAVLKSALKDTQLLLFSASLPQSTLQQASELLRNPELVRVTERITVATNISHMYFATEQRDKFEVLRKLIGLVNPTRALIFINRSSDIEWTVEKLKFHGLDAEGIHGSSEKSDRKKIMDDFRSGKLRLLVASDLAARGLDIKEVSHIFNLDFPEDPQNYLHRVGRTGRAGLNGVAISLTTPREVELLEKAEKAFKIKICEMEMFKGEITPAKKMVSEPEQKSLAQPTKPKAKVKKKEKEKEKVKVKKKVKVRAKQTKDKGKPKGKTQ